MISKYFGMNTTAKLMLRSVIISPLERLPMMKKRMKRKSKKRSRRKLNL